MSDQLQPPTREDRATRFEACRPHLLGLAYRLLGSVADAEDVLQDAYLRWQAAPRQEVASARAWLSTAVVRLCVDALGSARHRRETYVGPWLPEPIETARVEPLDRSSLSLAFLVVLEALSPLERAAFVMREVFDYELEEVARVLGREEGAVRKLVQRARAHVAERRVRFSATPEAHAALVGRFLQVVAGGDLRQLEALLVADATASADGGARVAAARRTVQGRTAVARYLLGLVAKGLAGAAVVADLNGSPAILLLAEGVVVGVVEVEGEGDQVQALRLVVNPEKLGHLGPPPAGG